MAKKTARTGLLATLDYPFRVEISAAEFEPISLLPYLDVSKLSKGNHNIEVGFVKGGCCDRKAFAVVKAGIVVAIRVESCLESKKPLSREARALVAAAYKKVDRRRKWAPVNVTDLFGKSDVAERLSVGFTGSCLRICWGDAIPESPRMCILCCYDEENDRVSCSLSESSSVIIF